MGILGKGLLRSFNDREWGAGGLPPGGCGDCWARARAPRLGEERGSVLPSQLTPSLTRWRGMGALGPRAEDPRAEPFDL